MSDLTDFFGTRTKDILEGNYGIAVIYFKLGVAYTVYANMINRTKIRTDGTSDGLHEEKDIRMTVVLPLFTPEIGDSLEYNNEKWQVKTVINGNTDTHVYVLALLKSTTVERSKQGYRR